MKMINFLISKWYYYTALTLSYLQPIEGSLIAVGVLITIDLAMGIAAARKEGIQIKSKRLFDTVTKLLVYQLLIIAAFITETNLADWLPLTKITTSFIGITELVSVGENFTKVTGLPFITYLKNVIKNYTKNSAARTEIEDSIKNK